MSFDRLLETLRDPKLRQLYVAARIKETLPLQIRAMRTLRGWSQEELAKKMGSSQSVVARLERPKTCKPSTEALAALAEIFDVGLIISFVPFGRYARLAGETETEESIAIPEYADSSVERLEESRPQPEPAEPPQAKDEPAKSTTASPRAAPPKSDDQVAVFRTSVGAYETLPTTEVGVDAPRVVAEISHSRRWGGRISIG